MRVQKRILNTFDRYFYRNFATRTEHGILVRWKTLDRLRASWNHRCKYIQKADDSCY